MNNRNKLWEDGKHEPTIRMSASDEESTTANRQIQTMAGQNLTTAGHYETEQRQNMTTGEQNVTAGEQNVTAGEQNMTAGGQNATSGGQNMTTGEQNVTAEGQNVTAGGQNVTAGGQNMTAGGQNVTVEGPNMTVEGQNMTTGGQNMTAGGQNMTSEGQNMTSEGPNMTAGGQNVTAGGQNMTSGGQNMTAGGQNMTSGGRNMTSGGQNVTAEGPNMTVEGPNMTAGGPNMTAGGQNVTAGGQKMTEGGQNVTSGGQNTEPAVPGWASAQQIHILGLPSWYPAGANDHNGLFCITQLQALAAMGHKVGIVAAVSQTSTKPTVEVQEHGWGTACVARYRSGTGQTLQAIRYALAMHKAWRHYQKLMGRPQHALVLVAWKAGLFARWLKIRHGLKYNIIEHWSLYLSNQYLDTPLYLKHLFKYIYSGARSVAAVSLPLSQALSDHNLTKNRCKVIPNVVDTDCFRPLPINVLQKTSESELEQPTDVDASPPFLMHVSNLAEVKNFGFILEVLAVYRIRYPHARLWVAGAFNPDDARKQYAHKSANVEWFGFADSETLCRHYRQSVALLVASKHETFSIVTAEAIACGCPVLSSPLPALDAFRDWGTLHSLPANDPEAWAEVLSGWTQSRPLPKKGSWEGIDNAYGKKSVGECISKWITAN